jgi:biopolymer transport protein ExbD
MAEINTGGDKEVKKNKPKKQHLRVDFTPMVDMNMLLITFFMFCTTLSKPQIMNLVVPSKDKKEILDDNKPKTADSRTTTVILAGGDIVYYYFGKPDYENPASLHATDLSPEGLRAVLVEKNGDVIREMARLRQMRQRDELSETEFNERSGEIKDNREGQVVIIKPTAESTYENLVNALDEMQICSIGTYALVEPDEGDMFLIGNHLQTGAAANETSGQNTR